MSYKIELDPKAIEELESAYQWYEERQKDVGLRFVSMVDKRLKEIAAAPMRYAKTNKHFRETRIEIFPYIIIYEIIAKEKIVYVLYIFIQGETRS